MKLLVSTVAPYPWVKLNKHGKPVDKGQFIEAAFLSTIARDVKSVIGVAPANSTTFHEVQIPTRKRSNMLSAVPFALEDSLSEDIDQLHFTVMDWKAEGPAEVAVVARQTLQAWLDVFEEAGVKLDALVPELSLLPIHSDSDATLVRLPGQDFAIKTAPYKSFGCDQAAFEYWWSDEQNRALKLAINDKQLAAGLIEQGAEHVSYWAIGEDFRSWLEHAPEQLKTTDSMLHGEFEPAHLKPGNSWLNFAAGLAIASVVLLGVSNWVEADRLQRRYDTNQQEIRRLFDENFPDEEYLGVPRRQIASLLSISEDDPADEMFQYLLASSVQAAPANKVKLDEINYRDQQLQIGVSAPNFAALENLTSQLNAEQGLQAALISSGSRDQRVTGQIKIISDSL